MIQNKSFNMRAALKSRYAGENWAFMFEVPSGTGSSFSRRADAIAMSLWPSMGLELHGIECKASRTDWLKELKDPSKSDAFYGFVDRWWLAVSDPTIVRDGELPPTWGLLIPRGDDLFQKVAAPKLEPKPVSRPFLAGLLREAMRQLVPKEVKDDLDKRSYQDGIQAGTKQMEHERDHWKRCHDKIMESIKSFEAQSGLTITGYSGGNLGNIVHSLYRIGEIDRIKSRISNDLDGARSITIELQKLLINLGALDAHLISNPEHTTFTWSI